MISSFEQEQGTANMNNSVNYLQTNHDISKIGSIGWCFGGGQSLNLALNNENMDASVIYYGKLVTEPETLSKIQWPTLGIFALFTAGTALFMLSGYKPKSGMSSQEHKIVEITGGSGLGFLAGLIGRGGVFIVPLLYMTGIDTKQAIATSAFIVTMTAVSGFVSHIFTAADLSWIFGY